MAIAQLCVLIRARLSAQRGRPAATPPDYMHVQTDTFNAVAGSLTDLLIDFTRRHGTCNVDLPLCLVGIPHVPFSRL